MNLKIKERAFKMYRIIRRIYYYHFNRNYLIKSLGNRKGECKHCGQCYGGCYFMKIKANKIYCMDWINRPGWCRIHDFPFDNTDLKLSHVKNCGYYWN